MPQDRHQRISRSTVLLSSALLFLFVIACGSSSSGSTQAIVPTSETSAGVAVPTPLQTDGTTSSIPDPTTEPTEAPVTNEPGVSRSNPLPLGTELRFETWSVTISQVERGDTALQAITQANQFNEVPADGFEYLLVSLKITNIGKEQKAQNVTFAADVRVTGERNILYSSASVVSPKVFEGELFPEGSAEGQIAFAVPVNEKNLMFYVNENFSIDSNAARFIAIDDGAKVVPPADLANIQPTDIGSDRSKPAKLGETIVTEVWETKVLEVLRGEEAVKRITEANQFNEAAPEGQEYIAVKVHVRYIDQEQADQVGSANSSLFRVTGEKQVVYDRPSVVPPIPELDANLFPGGEAEGWVVVSVATGEQGISFVFQPLFSFSDADVRYLAAQ